VHTLARRMPKKPRVRKVDAADAADAADTADAPTDGSSVDAEAVVAILMQYAVPRLCEMVDAACTLSEGERAVRKGLVRLLDRLVMTCRSARDEARLHEAYRPVLFYERMRLDYARHFFLDGVPTGLALFAAPTSITLSDEDVARLRVADVLHDRSVTVHKLEGMSPTNPRKMALIAAHGGNMSAVVPGSARVLVARVRAVHAALMRSRPPGLFVQCCNANCNRLFYTGDSTESPNLRCAFGTARGQSPAGPIPPSGPSGGDYWQQIDEMTGSAWRPATNAPRVRFCSQACACQHAAHVAWLVSVPTKAYDAEPTHAGCQRCTSSGAPLARVEHALSAALRRNERLARVLRTPRTRRDMALSPQAAARAHACVAARLNVDVAILHASARMTQWPMWAERRRLPGCYLHWRSDPSVFAKVMRGVASLYVRSRRPAQQHPQQHPQPQQHHAIVTQTLTVPSFVSEASRQAARLLS